MIQDANTENDARAAREFIEKRLDESNLVGNIKGINVSGEFDVCLLVAIRAIG